MFTANTRPRFYPAPGWRNFASGALLNVGSHGRIWSASIHSGDGDGYHLFFGYDLIGPDHHYRHAYGLQLRCLQE
ncbi:MAG: hypothetical protein K2K83_04800 [Rikenella sp.]|nr:hypothetical protein [Rikenella sp.]